MKKLRDIPRTPKKESKLVNERQELVGKILTTLNNERIGTRYKPLTAAYIGVKLEHTKTKDLEAFYRQCVLYKGEFSKCFFGCLKV